MHSTVRGNVRLTDGINQLLLLSGGTNKRKQNGFVKWQIRSTHNKRKVQVGQPQSTWPSSRSCFLSHLDLLNTARAAWEIRFFSSSSSLLLFSRWSSSLRNMISLSRFTLDRLMRAHVNLSKDDWSRIEHTHTFINMSTYMARRDFHRHHEYANVSEASVSLQRDRIRSMPCQHERRATVD